ILPMASGQRMAKLLCSSAAYRPTIHAQIRYDEIIVNMNSPPLAPFLVSEEPWDGVGAESPQPAKTLLSMPLMLYQQEKILFQCLLFLENWDSYPIFVLSHAYI